MGLTWDLLRTYLGIRRKHEIYRIIRKSMNNLRFYQVDFAKIKENRPVFTTFYSFLFALRNKICIFAIGNSCLCRIWSNSSNDIRH